MSARNLRPITIVGGGLAGLTLGIALRQKGVPVVVFESGHYPRHRVCGEFISGRGQSVLGRLGLGDVLAEAGARVAEDAVFVIGERSGPVRKLEQPGLAVPRVALDAALSCRFEDLGGDLQIATRWKDGHGEGVVLASGRRLESAKQGSRWFGLKVHVQNVPLGAALELHSLPHGYVGMCRLKGGTVNVCGLFRRVQTTTSETLRHASAPRPEPQLVGGPTAYTTVGADHALGAQGSPSLDAFKNAWTEVLRGNENTLLAARLSQAVFDQASFCSVAGLAIRPQLTSASPECRIGDALTMTPPVTGNGMSMAFEAAEQAVEPLVSYSHRAVSWAQAERSIAQSCRRVFSSRLAWAGFLQWFMLAPTVRHHFSRLALNSGLLWHILFAKTR